MVVKQSTYTLGEIFGFYTNGALNVDLSFGFSYPYQHKLGE